MKLNVFQKISVVVLAGMVGSVAQAQTANVADSLSGTYTLTYAYAQSGSPFTNGTVKTFVINGATDTLCVDGVSVGTGTTSGSEIIFSGGGGIYYALSVRPDGSFNEINVNSPGATGSWRGQFLGSRTSTNTACAGAAPTLSTEQEAVIELAAGLYPDLFESHGDIKSAQGYTYLTFTSGVSVGFKDGSLYLAGGPFGAGIQNKGTVAQVATALTNLRNSVTVTPTTDMTSLFTLAAQVYPTLFGNGTSFQTSADGYLYKYFDSGIYAAIKNGNVYVKGGVYGTAYTSVGALNTLLGKLNTAVNGGGTSIPAGDYDLVVSGTVSIAGFGSPFSFAITDIPAPDVSDQDEIEAAFINALQGSGPGATITAFTYTVKSNTASLVEFDMTVSATINQSGFSTSYSYTLNYKYTR